MYRLFYIVLTVLSFQLILNSYTSAAVISGKVTSATTAAPLINANVILEGTGFGASTDLDGRYVIHNIPPGAYTIHASIIGYNAKVITDVNIYSDTETIVDFTLEPGIIELEEIVVKAGAAKGSVKRELDERLTASIITDGLSGESIKSMPDPDVAQVVRRATGVSTVGGDPVIRGLGLRYSKVTLNNSHVAGTEPNRSGVSLEIFPSSMMSKVNVKKSYLPDQFGEFGGGTIDMNTWEISSRPEFNFSLSTGYKPNTTLNHFKTYAGGNLDFLGFDDGTRSLPDPIANADTKINQRGRFSDIGYPADELERLGESFSNNWNMKNSKAAPNLGLALSFTNGTTLWGKRFGYLVSCLYKNSNSYKKVKRNIYKGGTNGNITLQHTYDFKHYIRAITLGGMAALRYDISPLSILTFNTLVNRDVEDEARYFEGYNDDRQMRIQDTRFRFVVQNTLTTQLSGHHIFPSLGRSKLKWQAVLSRGIRNEPDTREVQYEKDEDDAQFALADENQSGSRIFNNLFDNTVNITVDYSLPISKTEGKSNLKTGIAYLSRHRNSKTRFFQFEPRDNHDVDLTQDPQSIFHADNIDTQGFMVREATRPTDSYYADHDVKAVYLMADAEIAPRIRIIGGLRYEHSTQEVTSYELFAVTQTPVVGQIATRDILPALNVIYTLGKRTNLRFAASQTISRPDFRELSEFEFTDIIGGHAVIGNPNLKRALIRHLDMRYEWAHGMTDLLSVSFFYKHFINPIEVIIQPTAQHRVSYENAKSANNYGIEIELRQALGELVSQLQPWSVSTNLTLLRSDIQLSDTTKGTQTSSRRPLHGQSSYLFNFNLRYDNTRLKTQADIFLHIFGKRISEVGSKPLPDIYELSHPDMDLTVRHPLNSRLTLKVAIENILDPEIKFKQGDKYTQRNRSGTVYSVGLSYRNGP